MKKLNLKDFKNIHEIVSKKQYDDLYTIYGEKIYTLFTPFSYKSSDIKKLMLENNFLEIYNKYGLLQPLFVKGYLNANNEYFCKLRKEKKYLELERIYGVSPYEGLKDDIEYEMGKSFKARLYSAKVTSAIKLKKTLKTLVTVGLTLNILISGKLILISYDEYNKALVENANLIEMYDEKVKDYAASINNLNLDNDLDIVMKVMDDMWNEMEGYGTPLLDATSLGRLDFVNEGGVGVCRNIADDLSARLNAINPEYNARNVAVYMDFNMYNSDVLANIERNIIRSNETSIPDTPVEENIVDSILDKIDIDKTFGNHMVTVFEPIGKDYSLIVDATNPSIGIIVNGKIYLFSTQEGKGLKFVNLGQIIHVRNYNFSSVYSEFSKTLFDSLSSEELISLTKEWGLEAQNSSLEKVRDLCNNIKK